MSYGFAIVHDGEGLRVDLSPYPNLEQYLRHIPKGRWSVNGHIHSPGTAADTLGVTFTHADGRFGGSAQGSGSTPAPAQPEAVAEG